MKFEGIIKRIRDLTCDMPYSDNESLQKKRDAHVAEIISLTDQLNREIFESIKYHENKARKDNESVTKENTLLKKQVEVLTKRIIELEGELNESAE